MAIFHNTTDTSQDKFYCLSGYEDFFDEDGFPRSKSDSNINIVAKILYNRKSKDFTNSRQYGKFYIKLDPNDKLFNPKQILSSVSDKASLDFINNTCKKNWNFKEVTPQVFQKYINFLKTKNLAWLKEAQRDLL